MRRALALVAALAACGDAHRPASAPVAMTIKPVAPVESAAIPPPPVLPEANAELPVQLVFFASRLCVRSEGRIYCQPQSGLAVTPLAQDKLRIGGVEDAIDVSSGRQTMCVVTRRGTVMCTGFNHFGELGAKLEPDSAQSFVEVVGVTSARRVSVGANHACALLDDKSVKCWGRNDHGQTGSDTHYLPEARQLVTATLVRGVQAETVAAGSESTCARTLERRVVCWGATQDQSRAMKTGQHVNERPTRMPDLEDISALFAHEEGYCAIRRGQLLCWGQARRLIPGTDYFGGGTVAVAEIKEAEQLALSDGHACPCSWTGGCPASDTHIPVRSVDRSAPTHRSNSKRSVPRWSKDFPGPGLSPRARCSRAQ